MLETLLCRLEALQEQDAGHVCFGNYQSTRYHGLLPIKRDEDNVYFVSWINQLLKRHQPTLPQACHDIAERIIGRAETSISTYANRYGEESYNFYRPKAWFPNGVFLSRFGVFQPTDDSDDSSIAYRGKSHSLKEAQAVKAMYEHQANGMRGRWVRRLPKKYRSKQVHNTWIGSEKLFIDIDLIVHANILVFSAQYGLDLSATDQQTLEFIQETVSSGEYLEKTWSLCAWYPFASVILYSLSDLVSLGFYPQLDAIRERLIKDIHQLSRSEYQITERLLLDSALMKLGEPPRFADEHKDIGIFEAQSKDFSFGVIPLLNPFDGLWAQYLSKFRCFRMYYDCAAQRIAILLEYEILREKRKKNKAL